MLFEFYNSNNLEIKLFSQQMKSLQEIKYQYPGMTAYHTKIEDKNSTWVQANSFLSLVKKSLRSYNIFHSFTFILPDDVLFIYIYNYVFIESENNNFY